jgi:alanine dehydrogenase
MESLSMTAPDAPVFVSADAADAVFDWKDAVGALQAAYAVPMEPGANPPRVIGKADKAWLRTLPAMAPGGRYFGAKLMGMSVGSATPGVEYVVVLFDRQTSRIAAFVDANILTGYRTAATSAAALDKLAPAGPARLAVLGSGLEATMHTRAFAAVRPLSEIVVFSPTEASRARFAATLSAELGVPCRAVADAETAVRGADIVLAAARSRGERPILFGHWLTPGMTVVSIGSTVPEQREIDASVVEKADFIVCDTLEEVLEETGDMIAAQSAGIDLHARCVSLNALMSGAVEAQRTAASISMFKSVGAGLQDVVVAELVLTKALAAGLATRLPISFLTKRGS